MNGYISSISLQGTGIPSGVPNFLHISENNSLDLPAEIRNNPLFAKKASILLHLHRQLLVIGINQKIAIQWDFPITYEMARAYQKANGKYLRQNQWEDITLVMSLELGK